MKPKTAVELVAELKANSAYQEQQSRRAERLATEAEERRIEQKDLLADLEGVGCRVQSVWDLVNTSIPYPKAIPVLLKHLQHHYSDRIREGIARALATPDSGTGWPILSTEYRKAVEDSGAKSGLAVALAAASTEEHVPELASFIRDEANGNSRLLLLRGLKKAKSEDAKIVLKEIENEPAFKLEIASWKKRAPRK